MDIFFKDLYLNLKIKINSLFLKSLNVQHPFKLIKPYIECSIAMNYTDPYNPNLIRPLFVECRPNAVLIFYEFAKPNNQTVIGCTNP